MWIWDFSLETKFTFLTNFVFVIWGLFFLKNHIFEIVRAMVPPKLRPTFSSIHHVLPPVTQLPAKPHPSVPL